jgi:hypothetical protein
MNGGGNASDLSAALVEKHSQEIVTTVLRQTIR